MRAKRLFCWLCLFCLWTAMAMSQEQSLAEALGYPQEARILIINADDFGMCHAQNLGTKQVLERGIVTSTTMMMVCPWIREAVEYTKINALDNVGVHVTLTSEWDVYRWSPLSRPAFPKCSLTDSHGYFWPDTLQVELHADIDEVKEEVKAQIQRAINWGVQPSHFDSHMGALYGHYTQRVELLAIALSYSYEFGIPYRLPYMKELKTFRDMGFAILDHLILPDPPSDLKERKQYYLSLLKNLKPGVSELYIHPAVYTEELANITYSAHSRQADRDIFIDPELQETILCYNIHLISYQPLKKWQREKMNWKPTFHAEDVYEKYVEILQQHFSKQAKKQEK